MNHSSKGIWLPVVLGLAAIIYCGIGYANWDFGNGKLPVPWFGAILFVVCIIWAGSKGTRRDKGL